MEFDKPSTKYLFIAMVTAIVLGLGFMNIYIHKMDQRRAAAFARETQDCINLNPKYGEALWVKEGFHSGRELLAVEYSELSIGLIDPFGIDKKVLRFRCGDIQREAPKAFRKEPETKR